MNSKFLIIYTAYNQEEYVEESLSPFLRHPNCWVVASSRKFKKFDQPRTDLTVDILEYYHRRHSSRFLGLDASEEVVEHEHLARNAALQLAANRGLYFDYIWIVDSDEFYKTRDINAIIEYVEEKSQDFSWFSIPLKNFVFDKDTYLAEPFCPPRIFKTSFFCDWTRPSGHFFLHSFFWDNDVAYSLKEVLDGNAPEIPLYKHTNFAGTTIPKEVAWVDHLCWLNDERSKQKVAYQNQHFGLCSYAWDEEKGLVFNVGYYAMTNTPWPEIIKS